MFVKRLQGVEKLCRQRGREAVPKPCPSGTGDGHSTGRGKRCKVKEKGFDMLKGEQYIWELTECVEKS